MSSYSSTNNEMEVKMMRDDNEDHESQEQEMAERGNWSGKCDFFMSCLSYAVGLGNLWRFPYLCYENGGGAFLIPYTIMMIFAGMPLFFLELSLGQYSGKGITKIWRCSPMFTGIGYAMFLVSACVGIYYNMVIAWAIYYTIVSFASDVPWKTCQNDWNTPACSEPAQFKNCTALNGTWYNQTCWTVESHGNETFQYYKQEVEKVGRRSASYEYFHYNVLNISEGITDMGTPQWQMVLCLIGAWVIVFLCLVKGIKSSGKAVYFTALFPYVVLIVLLAKAATLEGSLDGIAFYIVPKWERLLTAKVWGDAAVQIFFSLSPCWGGLITLASYNQFHNNALRDAIVVTLSNCATSIFAGFVIFSIIGFMANQLNLDVEQVAVKGAGLAFVAYPEVVSQLPISPLWSVLFFLMLITLGLGSQMTIVNTVYTLILDQFSKTLRQGHRPKLVLAAICAINVLLGLSLTCHGGMYVLQLMDNYAASYTTLIIGLIECVAISHVYGWNNYAEDIKLMIGTRPRLWWRIMWQFVTPLIVLFILIFTFVDFSRTSYDGVVLPIWADIFGWCLVFVCLLPIPGYAIYLGRKEYQGTFLKTLKHISRPSSKWGPSSSSGELHKPKETAMTEVISAATYKTPEDEPLNIQMPS